MAARKLLDLAMENDMSETYLHVSHCRTFDNTRQLALGVAGILLVYQRTASGYERRKYGKK
jgi:hypothetical protein